MTAGMARTRAHDYDDKRLAILRRSARLFARHGYAGTSITMIATACGMSKALLYHYYADKEAVLFDILSNHLQRLVAAVEKASAADGGDRLFLLSSALLDAYRDADAEHQVQIAGLKLLPEPQQERLKVMERVLVDLFCAAIADAVPAVGDGPFLKPITMSHFGMLNWHYLWFREGGSLSREDYARLATHLTISGAASAVTALASTANGDTARPAATRRGPSAVAAGARKEG